MANMEPDSDGHGCKDKNSKIATSDYNKIVTGTFEEFIGRVTEELKKEGFGILTQIDVTLAFKEKLNRENFIGSWIPFKLGEKKLLCKFTIVILHPIIHCVLFKSNRGKTGISLSHQNEKQRIILLEFIKPRNRGYGKLT